MKKLFLVCFFFLTTGAFAQKTGSLPPDAGPVMTDAVEKIKAMAKKMNELKENLPKLILKLDLHFHHCSGDKKVFEALGRRDQKLFAEVVEHYKNKKDAWEAYEECQGEDAAQKIHNYISCGSDDLEKQLNSVMDNEGVLIKYLEHYVGLEKKKAKRLHGILEKARGK